MRIHSMYLLIRVNRLQRYILLSSRMLAVYATNSINTGLHTKAENIRPLNRYSIICVRPHPGHLSPVMQRNGQLIYMPVVIEKTKYTVMTTGMVISFLMIE